MDIQNGLTDNEIIKALECCVSSISSDACNGCPFDEKGICDKDTQATERYALDLINRQKAEIERLQKFKSYFDSLYGLDLEILGFTEDGNEKSYDEFYDSAISDMGNAEHHIAYITQIAKSEAIKEFAERLKKEAFSHKNFGELVYVDDIDNLVKEMTESE